MQILGVRRKAKSNLMILVFFCYWERGKISTFLYCPNIQTCRKRSSPKLKYKLRRITKYDVRNCEKSRNHEREIPVSPVSPVQHTEYMTHHYSIKLNSVRNTIIVVQRTSTSQMLLIPRLSTICT